MDNFFNLYKAGYVKRWHTHDTQQTQDLAAHSWGVAMICNEVLPGSLAVVLAGLNHDLAESLTGDIPYTAKIKYPALKNICDQAETEFEDDHGMTVPLTDLEQAVLEWADMFEAYLFAQREVKRGNQGMIAVIDTAFKALVKMGFPNERAEQLFRSTYE